MKKFIKGDFYNLPYSKAIKRPISVKCIQINEEFEVQTLEGVMKGNLGDYLMVGVNGEMYPCAKNIFEKTYDIIKEEIMSEKKIIMEKNGETKEISKEKLEEMSTNPDFQVTEESNTDSEVKVRIKERLFD